MCIPHIVGRQWLCKRVTAAMDTRAAIEEVLDASFFVQSVTRVVSKESRSLFQFNSLFLSRKPKGCRGELQSAREIKKTFTHR
jgi:hypothetical protein